MDAKKTSSGGNSGTQNTHSEYTKARWVDGYGGRDPVRERIDKLNSSGQLYARKSTSKPWHGVPGCGSNYRK